MRKKTVSSLLMLALFCVSTVARTIPRGTVGSDESPVLDNDPGRKSVAGLPLPLHGLEFGMLYVNGTAFYENNTYYLYQSDFVWIEIEAGPEALWLDLRLSHKVVPAGNTFNFTMVRDTYQVPRWNTSLIMTKANQLGTYQANITAVGPAGNNSFVFDVKVLNPSPVISLVEMDDDITSSYEPVLEGDSFQTYRDQTVNVRVKLYDLDGFDHFPTITMKYRKDPGTPETQLDETLVLTYVSSTTEFGKNVSTYTGTLSTAIDVANPTYWTPGLYRANVSVVDSSGNQFSYEFYLEILNLAPKIEDFWLSRNLYEPDQWDESQDYTVSVYFNASDGEDDKIYQYPTVEREREFWRRGVATGQNTLNLTVNDLNSSHLETPSDGNYIDVDATRYKHSVLEFWLDLSGVNTEKLDVSNIYRVDMRAYIGHTVNPGDGVTFEVQKVKYDRNKETGWVVWPESTMGGSANFSTGTYENQWKNYLFDSTYLPGNLADYANLSSQLLHCRLHVWDGTEDASLLVDYLAFTYNSTNRESFSVVGLALYTPTQVGAYYYLANEWWDSTRNLWKLDLTFSGNTTPGTYTIRLFFLDHGKLPFLEQYVTENTSYNEYFAFYKFWEFGIADATRKLTLNAWRYEAANSSIVSGHYHPKAFFNVTEPQVDPGQDVKVTVAFDDWILASPGSGVQYPWIWKNYTTYVTANTLEKWDAAAGSYEYVTTSEERPNNNGIFNTTVDDGHTYYAYMAGGNSSSTGPLVSSFAEFRIDVPFWVVRENATELEWHYKGMIDEDGANVWSTGALDHDYNSFYYWDWVDSSWKPFQLIGGGYMINQTTTLMNEAGTGKPVGETHYWNTNDTFIHRALSTDMKFRMRVDYQDRYGVESGPGATWLRIYSWNVSIRINNTLYGKLNVQNGWFSSSVVREYDLVREQVVGGGTNVSYWSAVIPASTFDSGNFTFYYWIQNSNTTSWHFGSRFSSWDQPYYHLGDDLLNVTFHHNQTLRILPNGISCTLNPLSGNLAIRRGQLAAFSTGGTIVTTGSWDLSDVRLEFRELNQLDDQPDLIPKRASEPTLYIQWNVTAPSWSATVAFDESVFMAGRYVYRLVFENHDATDNVAVSQWQEIRVLNDPPKPRVYIQDGGDTYRIIDNKPMYIQVEDLDTNPADYTSMRLEMDVQNRDLVGYPYQTAVLWTGSAAQVTLNGSNYDLNYYINGQKTYAQFPRWALLRTYNHSRFVFVDDDPSQPQTSVLNSFRVTYNVLDVPPELQRFTLRINGTEYEQADGAVTVYRNTRVYAWINFTDWDDPEWHRLESKGTLVHPDLSAEYFPNSTIYYDYARATRTYNYTFTRSHETGTYSLSFNFTDPEGTTTTSPVFDIHVLNNYPVVKNVYYNQSVANVTYTPWDFKIYRGNETFVLDVDVYDEEDSWLDDFKTERVYMTLQHKGDFFDEDYDPIVYNLTHVVTYSGNHTERWRFTTTFQISRTFYAGNLTLQVHVVDSDEITQSATRDLKILNGAPRFVGSKYWIGENITIEKNKETAAHFNVKVWAEDYEEIRSIVIKVDTRYPLVVQDTPPIVFTAIRWGHVQGTNLYVCNVTLIGDVATEDNYEYVQDLRVRWIEVRDYDYQHMEDNPELGRYKARVELDHLVKVFQYVPPKPPDYSYVIYILIGAAAVVGVSAGWWFYKNKISYRKYL
ncbi:MAG: hypothetical protein Kow0069_21670 [Promethearchaeota archaeon]